MAWADMEGAGGEWVAFVRGLSVIGEGRAVALRLEIEADGEIEAVERVADGMTVTAVWVSESRVRVVVDGICTGDAICRVRMASGGARAWIAAADVYGYRWGDEGIERFAMAVEREEESGEGKGETAGENAEVTVSEEVTAVVTEVMTAVMTAVEWQESEMVTEDEEGMGTEKEEGKYIGCRETAVREGQFAVQFLFWGWETPVVCMEGGRVIRVETMQDGRMAFCTFRGLLGDGAYRFWVYNGTEVVEVVYCDGVFFEHFVKKSE